MNDQYGSIEWDSHVRPHRMLAFREHKDLVAEVSHIDVNMLLGVVPANGAFVLKCEDLSRGAELPTVRYLTFVHQHYVEQAREHLSELGSHAELAVLENATQLEVKTRNFVFRAEVVAVEATLFYVRSIKVEVSVTRRPHRKLGVKARPHRGGRHV